MRRHLMFLFLLMIPITLILTSCGEPADVPIRIGATMSETGSYSTQGIAARNGYQLCKTHVNEEGGVLGRSIDFTLYNDESSSATAVALYEQLITEEQVDAVMGPYGSTLTEAVAPVTEAHRMVHISPLAATTSIWEQGHEYLFMVLPPAELFLAGLIEMADDQGLERVAVLQEDALFPRAAGSGAADLARDKGMTIVRHETYPSGTTVFSEFLSGIAEGNTDVLAMAASALDDFILVVEQMKEMNVNVQMFGTSGVVEQFQQALDEDAEFTYGLSAWEPSLPHPGIEEFVDAYEQTFGIAPSFHAAGAYASCRIFVDAIQQAGSLDSDEIRDVLLALETTTVFGPYAVDERGYQIANQGVFIQWQDGEKVVVWPADVATVDARFPVPMWGER